MCVIIHVPSSFPGIFQNQCTFTPGGENERQIQAPQTAPPALVAQRVPVGPACPKGVCKTITTGPLSSEESCLIASNKRRPIDFHLINSSKVLPPRHPRHPPSSIDNLHVRVQHRLMISFPFPHEPSKVHYGCTPCNVRATSWDICRPPTPTLCQ